MLLSQVLYWYFYGLELVCTKSKQSHFTVIWWIRNNRSPNFPRHVSPISEQHTSINTFRYSWQVNMGHFHLATALALSNSMCAFRLQATLSQNGISDYRNLWTMYVRNFQVLFYLSNCLISLPSYYEYKLCFVFLFKITSWEQLRELPC